MTIIQKLDNPLSTCNLKFSSDDGSGEFQGYASVFNSDDLVDDTILPGAFDASISGGKRFPLFINHDHSDIPVGDAALKEDDHGLFTEGVIDMVHRDGPSVRSAMKSGRMVGMSIGFTMKADDYELKDADDPFSGRIIKNMDLREVSIVTFPCEPKAQIQAVKAADFASIEDFRALEAYLRDAVGLSKSAAIALVGRVKHLVRSESAPSVDQSRASLISTLNEAFKNE